MRNGDIDVRNGSAAVVQAPTPGTLMLLIAGLAALQLRRTIAGKTRLCSVARA